MDTQQEVEQVEARIDPLYAEPLLAAEEERRLFLEYRATRDAQVRERLILANMRLVRKWARGFAKRAPSECSLTMEDLVSEGVFGLMRAIDKYDVDSGFRFSTYASEWICQVLGRAIDNLGPMIRVPIYRALEIRREQRQSSTPEALDEQDGGETQSGDTPDAAPVCLSLDWSIRGSQTPLLERLPETLAAHQPAMGRRMHTARESTLEEHMVVSLSDHEPLRQALTLLSARQRYVIELRFGLHTGGEGMTLAAIGRSMNCSREYVRIIEGRALTILRSALQRTPEGDVVARHLSAQRQEMLAQVRLRSRRHDDSVARASA